MIFNCPACDAGHTVPVSMIPNGGLGMSCRRCKKPFLAHADGEVEVAKKDLGAAPVVIGTDAEHLDPPGATTKEPSPSFLEDSEATVEALEDLVDDATVQSVPEPTVEAADPAELEGDSELLATQRLPSDVGAARPVPPLDAATPSSGDKTPLIELEPERPSDEPSGSSVYDLVASGDYAPPPPASPTEAPEDGPKAWNEPSSPNLRVGGPLADLARAVERAPLAFKVALFVFPVALGLALLLTAGGEEEDPIHIPAQPSGATPALVAPPPVSARPEPSGPPAAEATPAPAEPSDEAPPPAEGRPDDRPAPEGYLYTQRGTRVRAAADVTAPASARLARGRLVRLYDSRGPWVLVMKEPDGPAGFVPRADLDTMRPIKALADDLAFEGCRARKRRDRPACRARAEAQLEACNSGCGDGLEAEPGTAEGRCREACRVAFERCRKGCRRR